jgi:hypothetical protein
VVDFGQKAELNITLASLKVKLCTPMFFGTLNPKMTLILNFSGPGGNNWQFF